MELFVIGLLIVLGTIFLVAEIAFIPGLGITGLIGIGSMLASVTYAFVCMGEIAGWITIAIVVLTSVSLILWAVYGKSLDNVALKKNIDSTVADSGLSNVSIGDRGMALTRLALIGEAEIGKHIIEVVSCDGFIDEKESIVVKRISGGVIYVAHLSDNENIK